MNEQFQRTMQDAMSFSHNAQLPDQLQKLTKDGVARGRDTFKSFNSVLKQQARASSKVAEVVQAGGTSVAEQLMSNTSANAEAFFDAVLAMASAKSIPEAFRIQADFAQQQTAAICSQSKGFLATLARASTQNFETMTEATSKAIKKIEKNRA